MRVQDFLNFGSRPPPDYDGDGDGGGGGGAGGDDDDDDDDDDNGDLEFIICEKDNGESTSMSGLILSPCCC